METREQMLEQILPLALHMAGKVLPRGKPGREDAVQFAAQEMTKALARFDPRRSVLSTYLGDIATAAFKTHYQRTARQVYVPALPRRRMLFRYPALAQRLGRNPDAVRAAMAGCKKLERMSDEEAWALIAWFDLTPCDVETPQARSEIIQPFEAVEETIQRGQVRQRLREAVAKLPRRHRLVIKLRFLEEEPRTLPVVGKRLKVTRQRIQQLQAEALSELRALLGGSLSLEDL